MSGHRIDVVLVKLCAVVIVVLSLQSLTTYVGFYVPVEGAFYVPALALFFNFGIPILLAAALWFFPAIVVGLRDPDAMEQAPSSHPTEPSILLGITLIGLYALVFGAIDLFFFEAVRLAEAAYLSGKSYGSYEPTPNTVAGRYTSVVQIFLGIVLLLGRRGIARLLSVARHAGTNAS